MNAKLLLVCLAVMLMAATESANAFAKRALRKKQETSPDMSDKELDKFEEIVALLKQMALEFEESSDDMQPARRALRKRQEGDMTEDDLEALADIKESLMQLFKQFKTEHGEMSRRRRR